MPAERVATSGPRSWIRRAVWLGALVAGCSLVPVGATARSGSCVAAPAPGNHVLALVVGSAQRTALVHVPARIRAGHEFPLVLVLHGYGGSGPQMAGYSGFSRVADRHGFVAVYPSSDGDFWNSNADPRAPDDVRFIGRLIGTLRSELCVDPHRVYVTGVSNGGGMAALAGCELSDEIAGIAPVAGGYDGQPPCRPTRPISLLEIHGTADQIVPYFSPGRRPTRDGLPRFVNAWTARDRCRPAPAVSRLAPRATLYRWSGCASGVRVEHIRILHGRHQWPGATPPDPGPPATFCATCEIWRFFSQLGSGPRRWPSAAAADGAP